MFDKYMNNVEKESSSPKEEIQEEEEYSFELPRSLLPWSNIPGKLNEYTLQLIEAGYTNVDVIASASLHEMEDLNIPSYLLEELIDNAQEWSIFRFKSAASLHESLKYRKRLSTGCSNLDIMLQGGIETRSVTEFYGEYITGKSQICLQLAVQTALPTSHGGLGEKVLYIDTEGAFNTDRIVQISQRWEVDPTEIMNNILVGRAYTTDLQMKMVDNILRVHTKEDVKLIIIDSLTSNFRAEYIGSNAIIDRQQKLNKHIQQLVRIAEVYDLAVVVTNQVMQAGNREDLVPVGGNIVAHGITHRIQLRKIPSQKSMRQADLIASPSIADSSVSFRITKLGIENP